MAQFADAPAVIADAKARMEKALAALVKELEKLRTGRASTALIDNVRVDYYGTPTPVSQIATTAAPDSRTVTIQPWDKAAFKEIEKAIVTANLGLTPINDGKIIRITIPPLTEERRKDLVKVAKKYAEEAKVAVRNVRREANDVLKHMKNDKKLAEDDMKKATDEIQKLTDSSVAKADQILAAKDKEIMEI